MGRLRLAAGLPERRCPETEHSASPASELPFSLRISLFPLCRVGVKCGFQVVQGSVKEGTMPSALVPLP